MSDSDSEEEFFMSGLRGPLVLEEDEVQSCSAEPDAISPLQLLELSFLRRDTHGVRNLLEGESDGWSELQKRVAAMALSLLLGDYVSVIISSDTVAPFDHFCRQCLSVDSPSKVPDAIRTIAVNYIQSGQADEVAWRTFEVVLLGCAHFYLFCQANYTGPEISADDMHSLSIASGMKKENDAHVNDMEMASGLESTRSKCESQLGQQVAQYGVFQSKDDCDVDMSAFKSKFILQILESDGNYAFPLCELPLMLVLGRSLLLSASCPLRGSWQAGITLSSTGDVVAAGNDDIFDMTIVKSMRTLCSRQWLSCRALVVHLRLLQQQSYNDNATLFKEMEDMFSEAETEINNVVERSSCKPFTSQCLQGHSNLSVFNETEGGIVPDNKYLIGLLYLEKGLACHHFDFGDKGATLFKKAVDSIGLEVKLTAAMGKRTKHQIQDFAQLVLLAKSNILSDSKEYNLTPNLIDANNAMEKCFGRKKEENLAMSKEWVHSEWELGEKIITTSDLHDGEQISIREVQLDSMDGGAAENILLEERVRFTAPTPGAGSNDPRYNVLHQIDQAALLALCLDISNNNPTGDQLTIEEMFPYLQAVLNLYHNHQKLLECREKVAKKNEMLLFNAMGSKVDTVIFNYSEEPVESCLDWMVYSTTLLERSYLEFEKRRTMDRALMQIQALLDQHTTRLTVFQSSRQNVQKSAPVYIRMRLLPSLAYPAQYEIKRDLAHRYLRCQIFNSALNLFKELEMWDEVVTCYQLLQKPKRAELLVRERLAKGEESPYMVCALADLTSSEELYERAWLISGKRYGRAKRTVARLCFDQGRYQECCDHLDEALRVQPLVASAWYLKGIACMRVENYGGGMEAFTRCVQQDMEISEAWGNLGAIHMHCKRYDPAYESLIEAQKYRPREWRLTENLLTVCIETGRYLESLRYMRQLLDLRHHKSNALAKTELTNNSDNINTASEHPTPVHIPHVHQLCVVVALRTLQFARQLDGGDERERETAALSGDGTSGEIVLPNLTVELESFLSDILTVLHVDTIYLELVIMYHDLILSGGYNGKVESIDNPSTCKWLQNEESATMSPPQMSGVTETWLRQRSQSRIRTLRMQQFRVLLNQIGWEKEGNRVDELLRVMKLTLNCYIADAQNVNKRDYYCIGSMIKTMWTKIESYYRGSYQLEGAMNEKCQAILDEVQFCADTCAKYETV